VFTGNYPCIYEVVQIKTNALRHASRSLNSQADMDPVSVQKLNNEAS